MFRKVNKISLYQLYIHSSVFSCVPLQVLLLDLPAPAPHPHEKLLIDLTNTPDLIRTNNKACTGAQVIFSFIIIILLLLFCRAMYLFVVVLVFFTSQTCFVSAADRPELSAHQVEPRGQEGEQRPTHQPLLLMRPQTRMAFSESNMKMCFINDRVLISQISTEAQRSG